MNLTFVSGNIITCPGLVEELEEYKQSTLTNCDQMREHERHINEGVDPKQYERQVWYAVS